MSKYTLTMDQIERIRTQAKTLFMSTQFIPIQHPNQPLFVKIMDEELAMEIFALLGDGGLVHLSTLQDYVTVWNRFRAKELTGLIGWLLQTTCTFKALAFESETVYEAWVDRLVDAYGCHSSKMDNTVDDDYVDRLPTTTRHSNILKNNPWIVYLMTLQLSYHEIFTELVIKYGLRTLFTNEPEKTT